MTRPFPSPVRNTSKPRAPSLGCRWCIYALLYSDPSWSNHALNHDSGFVDDVHKVGLTTSSRKSNPYPSATYWILRPSPPRGGPVRRQVKTFSAGHLSKTKPSCRVRPKVVRGTGSNSHVFVGVPPGSSYLDPSPPGPGPYSRRYQSFIDRGFGADWTVMTPLNPSCRCHRSIRPRSHGHKAIYVPSIC